MIKKLVAVGDLHYPEQKYMKIFEQFLTDEKPEILIYAGDIWNCEPISHWGDESRFKEIGLAAIRQQLLTEAQGIHDLIARQIKLAKAKEIYFLIGNHENWINMYQAKYGNANEPMTVDSLLKLTPMGVKILPQGKELKIGSMYLVHGDRISKSGQSNVAKTAVAWYQAPIFFWHYHTTQSYGNVRPIDNDSPQIGHLIGCMTDANPDYNKHKPNACIQQFLFAYLDTDKQIFSYYPVMIVKGQFIWKGKRYSEK